MSKHSPAALVKEFCTQRTSKCSPCDNEYASVVKNNPTLAMSFTFPRLVKSKTTNYPQNAHHLLCVAEVTKVMSIDKELQVVLMNTKYCINNSTNMMALPLFGHTVYWYCLSDHAQTGGRTLIGSVISAINPPPFKDLPNHDFDHLLYNREVGKELSKFKAEVRTADHSVQPAQISLGLNAMSDDFRKKLLDRGARKGETSTGGTHAAWLAANEGKIANWYKPFSMAQYPTQRGFPQSVSVNLTRLQNAVKNLLNG